MENLKVSVIMSAFNEENYLKESVESILSQTYGDFEFIIINDNSTDKTKDILNNLAKKDSRIKIITNIQNIGLTKSLNKAIKIARGEYIARQDADDISLPERFKSQIEFLDNNPDIKILGTFNYAIDKKGKVLAKNTLLTAHKEIKKNLIKRNPFIHSSVMIDREILNKVGLYNEEFETTQDYELWFRILKIAKGANLPLFLIKKRYWAEMISIKKEKNQLRAILFLRNQAIQKRDYPKTSYIYLLKPYLSLKCPLFIKKFLRKYILQTREIFNQI